MFLFIRRNAVSFFPSTVYWPLTESSQIQSHLQISKPIDPIFDGSAEKLSLYENVEDRLLSKAMRIPALQSSANIILSQPSYAVDYSVAFELIRAAETLDVELADWARRIPRKWAYTTITLMRYHPPAESSSSGFVPNLIHQYPGFYVGRVWNSYRVYRLIIQSILARVSSFVSLHHTAHEQDYIRIEKINRAMVDDVCASVPFLLGYDLSDLRLHPPFEHLRDENCLWPQNSMEASSSGPTGKFSLIWPLYVASSVPSAPETQRKWIRAQLKWIAGTGEAHAHLVMDAESQTLFGGPESFRFDCV
jgi:hypothetical protein